MPQMACQNLITVSALPKNGHDSDQPYEKHARSIYGRGYCSHVSQISNLIGILLKLREAFYFL